MSLAMVLMLGCALIGWNQGTLLKKHRKPTNLIDLISFNYPQGEKRAYAYIVLFFSLSCLLFVYQVVGSSLLSVVSGYTIKVYSIYGMAFSALFVYISKSNIYVSYLDGKELDKQYLYALWNMNDNIKSQGRRSDLVLLAMSKWIFIVSLGLHLVELF
ncbi:hypothetical protein BOW53_01680 [Solemya pervernicosa gill symbiont]|uniref:Uncharacterized protein n=1 Tax=Solemya pervernicosa gill symbiont TaxID=642797 RepID=A0A1T2LAC9_9GAMM|nr:hypothetical protein [Solemya pervernicosa gill symbiont]OOZ42068.1 hypothetical protein BOW53_01680 [Solemya pervernicosa gill symbiont]